jgi:uncharacterized protein (TIGR01732 family)
MYYYGQNYGYPQGGMQSPMGGSSSWGGVFAIILVLFILLVIIGFGCNGGCQNHSTCQCGM